MINHVGEKALAVPQEPQRSEEPQAGEDHEVQPKQAARKHGHSEQMRAQRDDPTRHDHAERCRRQVGRTQDTRSWLAHSRRPKDKKGGPRAIRLERCPFIGLVRRLVDWPQAS